MLRVEGVDTREVEQGIQQLLRPFIGQRNDHLTIQAMTHAIMQGINGLAKDEVHVVQNTDTPGWACKPCDISVGLDVGVFAFEGDLFSDPWDRIYAFDKAAQNRKAIHALFARVDSLALSGRWDVLTAWLKMGDMDRIGLTLLLGVASITLSMKDKLPYRAELMTKIKARVESIDPARAARLLLNL